MENPRPEKVAIVEEVKAKFDESDTVLLTDYRGLDVPAMAELRDAIRDAGGDYKIYKNTLVRFAAREAGFQLDDVLTGPTAIAFVGHKPDGSPGDGAAAAKALRDFSKKNPSLVLKGGLLGDKVLSVDEVVALADLPSREVLLARLAGGIAAPMVQFAGLLQALPRNLAYGLKALIDQAPADTTAPAADAAPAAEEAPASDEASTPADVAPDGPATEEAPAAEAAEEAPAVEATDQTPAADATEESPAAQATEEAPAAQADPSQEN